MTALDGRARASSSVYDGDFYRRHREGSRASARAILPLVVGWTRPESAVDVGCGVGTWLAVLRELGVEDVLGIDGGGVPPSLLEIPCERFLARDLTAPLDVAREFDLALSMEVAEHLPESAADTFVASLTRLAPVVLFSAAIPHQGGRGHQNERWPADWARRFRARGFVALDPVRSRVWSDPTVVPWYAQNTLVFAREDALSRFGDLERAGRIGERGRGDPLALVHPGVWARKAEPSLHRAWREFRRALARALARPFRRGTRGVRP